MSLSRVVGGTATVLNSGTWTGTPTLDVYQLRFRVQGAELSARVWNSSEAEPSAWDLQATDGDVTGAGDFRLGYVKVSSARWVYVDDITLASL